MIWQESGKSKQSGLESFWIIPASSWIAEWTASHICYRNVAVAAGEPLEHACSGHIWSWRSPRSKSNAVVPIFRGSRNKRKIKVNLSGLLWFLFFYLLALCEDEVLLDQDKLFHKDCILFSEACQEHESDVCAIIFNQKSRILSFNICKLKIHPKNGSPLSDYCRTRIFLCNACIEMEVCCGLLCHGVQDPLLQ